MFTEQFLQSGSQLRAFFALLLAALVLRQVLVFAGQHWIRTYAHTMTLILLPMVTFTITSVIAGNIALSLGLVGALSIVRFRNPVKSPFELVVYFLFITMGITASVSLFWLMLLIVVVVFVLATSKALDSILTRFRGKGLFQVSFSEGNELPTLELICNEAIDDLFRKPDLVSFTSDNMQFDYVLASRDKKDLVALMDEYNNDPRVKNIRYATY